MPPEIQKEQAGQGPAQGEQWVGGCCVDTASIQAGEAEGLEWFQRRAAKLGKCLESRSGEEQLREQRLLSLEKRSRDDNLQLTHQIMGLVPNP